MANRRMFAKDITNSDAFLDMPTSTQALYFHYGMNADDDGFVGNPKRISIMVGCSEDDARLLIEKGFVIPFNNSVVVITHWNMQNTIKKDRYHETIYRDQKAMLYEEENGAYTLDPPSPPRQLPDGTEPEPAWNQVGTELEPQDRVDKNKSVKDSGSVELPELIENKKRNNSVASGSGNSLAQDIKKTKEYASQCIRNLTEKNNRDINDFMLYKKLPGNLIRHAIDEACGMGKGDEWGYTHQILERYVAQGIKTVEAAQQDDKRFEKAKDTVPQYTRDGREYKWAR